MKLKKGLQIYLEDDLMSQKVLINSGIMFSDKTKVYYDKTYAQNSYVPKTDWRTITAIENDILISNTCKIPYDSGIGLFKLPQEVIFLLDLLNLKKYQSEEEVIDCLRINQPIVDQITIKMNQLLYRHLSKPDYLNFHAMSFTKPGLQTLSYFPKTSQNPRQYMGLHIDKSEPLNLSNMGTTRNRICVNIGGEARSMLCINLTLPQILKLLIDSNLVKQGNISSVDDITGLFFKHFQNYPVIKIKQMPYEYYVAPTDNYLHDGSTSEKTNIDITFTYLGYFNLNRLPMNSVPYILGEEAPTV